MFRPGFDGEPGLLALVVEDEFLIAMALEALLTSRGWRVLGPALSIEDALFLLRTKRPDVAVLDLNVKDRFITPVAEILLAWGVPFLVASGQRLREPGIGLLGNVPWVDKPINEERLLTVLKQLLLK
jgi:DNA-binding response OmpR family regulator